MIDKVSGTGNNENFNQKELLDIYDSLRQIDNRLTELTSSLEQELRLGQEFDLNDPDTYLELFTKSRSNFIHLSYLINYCKSNLSNTKRKLVPLSPEPKSEITKITQITIPQVITPEIHPKKFTRKTLEDLLALTRDVTLVLLAFFMMSYWTVKVFDDYRVINHFCKTFLEKQK